MIQRIDVYADADFYRSYIARLKLDDQAELLEGTRRELKLLTRQLVDAASLATVRESGMTGLSRPPRPRSASRRHPEPRLAKSIFWQAA